MLSPVKLLRKRLQRLRSPGCSVAGAEDTDVKRFLLNYSRYVQCQQKNPVGSATDIDHRTVALSGHFGFLWDQKAINHNERIVTKQLVRSDLATSAAVSGRKRNPETAATGLPPLAAAQTRHSALLEV